MRGDGLCMMGKESQYFVVRTGMGKDSPYGYTKDKRRCNKGEEICMRLEREGEKTAQNVGRVCFH